MQLLMPAVGIPPVRIAEYAVYTPWNKLLRMLMDQQLRILESAASFSSISCCTQWKKLS
jgi:hypothetical protein